MYLRKPVVTPLQFPALFDTPTAMVDALEKVLYLHCITLHLHVFQPELLDLMYSSFADNSKFVSLEIKLPSNHDRIFLYLKWKKKVPVFSSKPFSTRIYKDWRLKDLGIWVGEERLTVKDMHVFKQAIPSLERFWGEPIP